MAWNETCKIEACAQINHKKEELGIRGAMRALSEETGISYGTLRRWYYPEKSVPKNGNTNKRPLEIGSRLKLLQSLPRQIKKLIDVISELENGLPPPNKKSQKYYDKILSGFGGLRNCMDGLEEKIKNENKGGVS